ncbi:MAG: methyltransferase, FkbM family [Conexibacter sp.]|jgi:FkbM family methyltransferase|nr:methyltransferase, FkbM family [Conexibacter sp.]
MSARVKRVINGDPLYLIPEFALAKQVEDEWELRMYERFKAALHPGMTVLDVGASFGLYSMAGARRVGPSGRVVAFEPARRTASALRLHLEWNGAGEHVEVTETAVGASTGSSRFWEQEVSFVASFAEAWARREERSFATPVQERHVPTVALDDFCATRAIEPDVIKIDVEGAEASVLRGAREILARRQALLFLEVHADAGEPLALLDAAGWEHELLSELTTTRHYACAPRPR